MIIQKDGSAAYGDYQEHLPARRWANAPGGAANADDLARTRLHQDIFRPIIDTDWTLAGKSFFTMGSCFAREVEFALSRFGQTVLSKVEPGSPIAFRKGGYTNRYNTAAMVNELEFALGLREFNPASIVYADKDKELYQDLHSHPAGGFCTIEEAKARRAEINKLFSRIREADVFICTLGLTEVWFDTETGEYLNVSPTRKAVEDYYPGRFEFRVLDHADNMKNLARIYDIVRTHLKPDLKIIVTVSPVPLLATFSGRDVVQANTFSKSTLRSCAESWVYAHPGEIEYFPSFEMAMNSNRDVVWQEDLIHVTAPFVREIMRSFLLNFRCVDDPKELDQRAVDRGTLTLMKVDSYIARGDKAAAMMVLDRLETAGRRLNEVRLRKFKIYCSRDGVKKAHEYFTLLRDVEHGSSVLEIARLTRALLQRTPRVALAADLVCWLEEKQLDNWNLVRDAVALCCDNHACAKRILPAVQARYGDRTVAIQRLEARVAAGRDAGA